MRKGGRESRTLMNAWRETTRRRALSPWSPRRASGGVLGEGSSGAFSLCLPRAEEECGLFPPSKRPPPAPSLAPSPSVHPISPSVLKTINWRLSLSLYSTSYPVGLGKAETRQPRSHALLKRLKGLGAIQCLLPFFSLFSADDSCSYQPQLGTPSGPCGAAPLVVPSSIHQSILPFRTNSEISEEPIGTMCHCCHAQEARDARTTPPSLPCPFLDTAGPRPVRFPSMMRHPPFLLYARLTISRPIARYCHPLHFVFFSVSRQRQRVLGSMCVTTFEFGEAGR